MFRSVRLARFNSAPIIMDIPPAVSFLGLTPNGAAVSIEPVAIVTIRSNSAVCR